MNPVKAIRAKCIDCCGNMPSLVADCDIQSCAIHPFRMGRNPFRKQRKIGEAECAAMSLHLAAHRRAKSCLSATKNGKEGDL